MRLDPVKFYFAVYCLFHGAVGDPVYVSSPGVVRSYQGESATFLWILGTPLGDTNWFIISFYYERADQSIYSRVTGTSGGWAPDYENRANATFPEDEVSLGFTLYRIDEGDINYPYECRIQLYDGSRIRNNDATLFIFGPPTTPTLTPAPPDAVEKTEFSLTCSSTTTSVPAGLLPVMTYTWTRDGGPLPADRHSTRGDHGHELVIDTVQREDHQKVYRCQVRETGSKLSNSNQLTLDVQYGPAGISLSDTGPITVVEGNHVTVTCTSDCRPGCDYVWTGPGGYRHEGSNLSFQSINRDRHGNYTCQSSNDHGSASTELSVIVNFAPAITSFNPSQGDISRGDDVTLTCSVDSRPDSTVRISNSTSELDPIVRGNTAEFRFPQSVTVLDSGAYFCSASNGIEPNPDNQQLSLEVKGGFLPCNNQSVNETRGAALNDAFRIPSTSVSHYGTYTMTADNGEGQALVYTLLITPDGPPEAPTKLKCTDTTAVSLHLQWNAGHDGGADQTFVLTYTNTESGTANVVEIDGSGTPRGALVSHKLTDTQHILPDITYLIRLDSRNKNGKTGGPTITNRTLAQPEFVGDPTIVIEVGTALVTWPISNPESVTHIVVQVCDSDKADICNKTTVSDVSVQPYIVALPDANSFQFTFELYDGVEIVNLVTYSHDTDSLLMENVPMGNLRQYLRGMADHAYANTADSIQKECYGYIEQIIHGLEDISSLQPPALFYCLSTDHVLLGQGQICKLTGFNTAESVRQRERWEQEEGTDRPVGWLAPEAVDLQHVQKSDIWGLGVLLWEIVELGRMPYQGMDERQIIKFILQGDRLKVAPACTADIRDVTSSCWLHNPDSRRSVGEIKTMLGMTSA